MKHDICKYKVHLTSRECVELVAEKVRRDTTEDGIRTTVFVLDGKKVGIFFSDKVCGWTKEEIPKEDE